MKGILALLVINEILSTVVPWGCRCSVCIFRIARSSILEPLLQFLNRLNLTATRPASPSVVRPLPSASVGPFRRSRQPGPGDRRVPVTELLFLHRRLPLSADPPCGSPKRTLSASPTKAVSRRVGLWNTLTCSGAGIFLLATAVAAVSRPSSAHWRDPRAGGGTLLAAFGPDARGIHPSRSAAWGCAVVLILLAIFEEPIRWFRQGPIPRAESLTRKTDTSTTSSTGLGIVYMSGDDLSALKLTLALLMSRWRLLRDRLQFHGNSCCTGLPAWTMRNWNGSSRGSAIWRPGIP